MNSNINNNINNINNMNNMNNNMNNNNNKSNKNNNTNKNNGTFPMNDFCTCYYGKMSEGINTAFELFHPNVIFTIDGYTSQGSFNLLTYLVNQGVHHFEYDNLSVTYQSINNTETLFNANGLLKIISLWGQETNPTQFNEICILERIGNTYYIKNYVINIS